MGSRSLDLFTHYAVVSKRFERSKSLLRGGRRGGGARLDGSSARMVAAEVARDDLAMERAWDLVGVMSGHDPEAAEMVAEHYLFGEGWHDVAAAHRMGPDRAKKAAYAALQWLEGYIRADHDRFAAYLMSMRASRGQGPRGRAHPPA